MVPPEETSAIVPGLEEGKDYEFRVVPVNAAGHGEASDPTASIFTKARKGRHCYGHYFAPAVRGGALSDTAILRLSVPWRSCPRRAAAPRL